MSRKAELSQQGQPFFKVRPALGEGRNHETVVFEFQQYDVRVRQVVNVALDADVVNPTMHIELYYH
jgi:hypothetical protein